MKTSSEERNKFYYSSQYLVENDKGWLHMWSDDHLLKTPEYSYARTVNSEGLSDIEHPIKKSENEIRIIGLGDSFTEGDGADADSTWLRFLERDMSKDSIKKTLTFINAGVCASDLFFEYILLKERLLKYKPDIVLLSLNSTDISETVIRGGLERFKPEGVLSYNKAPWWEPVYAMSRIARLGFSALGYNELLFKEKDIDFKKINAKMVEMLTIYNELAHDNGFKFIVIFHPIKEEIVSQKMGFDDVYQKLDKDGRIEVFNLLDYFLKIESIDASNYSRYYWVKDGHHNAKGYEVFARGVEWKLREMGIIDSLKTD